MQITHTDDDGHITIIYDSRWANHEVLGYKPEDLQYRCLQEMWRKVTQPDQEEDDDAEYATHADVWIQS